MAWCHLVPFGAIWCLCCCTCGSLLAKVNWQNGSVYCSERLVKRPKKKSVIHCCCANIQRSPPMPVTASVQGQEHLEIACCKPIRLHAHGSHGLETISLHVFFVFISWYAIMYGYGSNLEYWSGGRLLSFLGWSGINRAKKGRWQLWLFDPYPYMHIYICYGQNIMGYNGCNHTSIPYSKWESKHNGCMNPCEGIDDWWPSSKNSSSFSSLASFHWSGLFLQPTLSTSRVKRVWAMPSPLPRRKRDSVG